MTTLTIKVVAEDDEAAWLELSRLLRMVRDSDGRSTGYTTSHITGSSSCEVTRDEPKRVHLALGGE